MVRDSMQKQLYVNGTINLNDSKNITADLHIKSENLQVMNTSMKDNPVFFGSIFINPGSILQEHSVIRLSRALWRWKAEQISRIDIKATKLFQKLRK